jgi:hypothetical protein
VEGIFTNLIAYLRKNSKYRVNIPHDLWGQISAGGGMHLVMAEMRQTAALRTLSDELRLLCVF